MGGSLQGGKLKSKPVIKKSAEKFKDFDLTSVEMAWDLDKMAEQAGSHLIAALEPLANRIQDYREQAGEINSALETSLERFTQNAAKAALVQTRSFEESIASISEQHISQTKQDLQSRMTQAREMAARSLEDEITSVSERLQHSHTQTFQMHLEEIFDTSRTKIAALEQQSRNVLTGLVRQMRSESEAIEHALHNRLKSDAEALEAQMVDAMRIKLQKLTAEFRSIFDGGRQDGSQ